MMRQKLEPVVLPNDKTLHGTADSPCTSLIEVKPRPARKGDRSEATIAIEEGDLDCDDVSVILSILTQLIRK